MSDVEQRLRDAHPNSQQYALGSNILLEAANEIAQLQARVQELEEDRERLEWMAKNASWICPPTTQQGPFRVYNDYDERLTDSYEEWRSAIDAAMQKEAE